MTSQTELVQDEIARLRAERDTILDERNEYLSKLQKEKVQNAELANRVLVLDAENKDLRRVNDTLQAKMGQQANNGDKECLKGTATISSGPATPPTTPATRRANRATSGSISSGGPAVVIDLTVSDDEDDGDLQAFVFKTQTPAVKQEPEQPTMPPAGSSSQPEKEMSVVPEARSRSNDEEPIYQHRFQTPQRYSNSPERDEQSISTPEPTERAGQKRKRAQNEGVVLPEPIRFQAFRPKAQNGSLDFSIYEPLYTRYLSECRPSVSINPPADENVLASRDELNKQYCCGAFNLIATIPPNKSPSPDGGALRLLFPSRDLNPLSVNQAGRPGLLFTSRTDIGVNETPLHVFSEHVSVDKTRWSYVGEYTLALAGRIESAQFSAFPTNIQTMWGRLVVEKDHQEGYLAMRGRIALRKTGVDDPQEKDVKHEMKKVEAGKGIRISPTDIVKALISGDECINILRMECVGYDHAFADDLRKKFPPKARPRPSKKRHAPVRKQDKVAPRLAPATSELRRSKRDRKARVLGPVTPKMYRNES